MDAQAVGGIRWGVDPGVGVIRHVGLPCRFCSCLLRAFYHTLRAGKRPKKAKNPGAGGAVWLLPATQSISPIPRRTRIAVPMRVMSASLNNRAAMGSSSVSSLSMWAA